MMSRALLILWLSSRFDIQNGRDEMIDFDFHKLRTDSSKLLLVLTIHLRQGVHYLSRMEVRLTIYG